MIPRCSRLQALPLLISILGLQACYVERLSRPKISGFVFDAETQEPIQDAEVGETKTDSRGFYELKVKTYREFTWIGMEAPPVYVREWVRKRGYEDETIEYFSTFGGGGGRDSHWESEPIFLRKKPTGEN